MTISVLQTQPLINTSMAIYILYMKRDIDMLRDRGLRDYRALRD